jgi:hypothetical protein
LKYKIALPLQKFSGVMGKISPYLFPVLLFFLIIFRLPTAATQEFDQPDAYIQTEAHVFPDSVFTADSLYADSLYLFEEEYAGPVYEWMGPHHLPAGKSFIQEAVIRDFKPVYVTSWILFSVILIGLAKSVFPTRFKEILMASLKSRYYNQLEREGGIFSSWVSFLLFVNYLFCLSLLFYQLVLHYDLISVFHFDHPGFILLYGLTFVAAWYVIKFAMLIFGGWVFKTVRSTESVLRTSLSGNNLAGVILLPVLTVNYYNPQPLILYSALTILLGIELVRIFRISIIGLRIRSYSVYHLILYLCTIEIAPVLFLLKYSSSFV